MFLCMMYASRAFAMLHFLQSLKALYHCCYIDFFDLWQNLWLGAFVFQLFLTQKLPYNALKDVVDVTISVSPPSCLMVNAVDWRLSCAITMTCSPWSCIPLLSDCHTILCMSSTFLSIRTLNQWIVLSHCSSMSLPANGGMRPIFVKKQADIHQIYLPWRLGHSQLDVRRQYWWCMLSNTQDAI